jgi:cellulose synthase/poly-beta-1,6-N-acetylglucosamine synthase-like glycosyltransferase
VTSVSVVVPTWQRPEQLERCLGGVLAQEHPAREVLVVARPEDAGTHAVLAGVASTGPLVRTIPVMAPGVIAAMNAGRTGATGEIVAFTDDDAVPDHDWLRRIVSHFECEPELGAVGGRDRLAGYDDPPVSSEIVGRVQWYGRHTGRHHLGTGPPAWTDVLKGVNVAFRRVALDPIGFDPRLQGAGAQPNWEFAVCLALKRAGWRVLYDPAVAVEHYEGPRFGATRRGFVDLSELSAATHNQTYAMIRWLPPWRKPVVLAYEFVVGSRIAPGVLTAIERGSRTRQWRRVLMRLGAATRGRARAIRTYMKVLHDRS